MPADKADLAIILAGGEGRRLGGADKGALAVGREPLWRRVADRLRPQAKQLAVVAPLQPAWLPEIPDAIWLADASSTRIGPAGALAAGLKRLAPGGRLLTSPVDAAFLPCDLHQRLAEASEAQNARVALAASGGASHPVFGLWSGSAAPAVLQAIESGEHSLRRLAALAGMVECEAWNGVTPDPFFNINTPTDLTAANELAGG